MRMSHCLASLLLALACGACSSPPDPADAQEAEAAGQQGQPSVMMHATPEQIEHGRQIAQLKCASCHAVGAHGRSRSHDAPELRKLSERYPVTALEEAFAEGVMVGHSDMPEYRFSAEEIAALLGYLESIQVRRGG